MDTRRLRRWLGSRDPVDVVVLPEGADGEGLSDPDGHGARPGRDSRAVVVVPGSEVLETADLLHLLGCARRVDVVLPQPAGVVAAAGGPGGATSDEEPERADLAAVVEHASELAAMCGRPGGVGMVGREAAEGLARIDPDHMPIGRRALIGAADRPLPEPASTPQRRLVDAVKALLAVSGRTALENVAPEPATGSARLLAKGCCGEGLCVRVCPRDALRLEVVELEPGERPGPPGVGAPPKPQSQFRLVQVAADCDGCDACIEMCPNGSLSRVGDHSWSDLLEYREHALRTGWVRECSRCGAAHRQMGDLCAVCKAQQENPFAVRLPSRR